METINGNRPPAHKKVTLKFALAVLGGILLVVGAVVAYYLSTQKQEIRQQASVGNVYTIDSGGHTCQYGASYNGGIFVCNPAPSATPQSSGCFVAGTKITMADNSLKNIEDVKVGDVIKSYDVNSNQVLNEPVLQLEAPINTFLVQLTFANGTVTTNTTNHRYYVKNKGWAAYDPAAAFAKYKIQVSPLVIGDTVITYSDGVVSSTILLNAQPVLGPHQTYNLSAIQDTHTFFANGILVHNVKTLLIDQSNCTDPAASYFCSSTNSCVGGAGNCPASSPLIVARSATACPSGYVANPGDPTGHTCLIASDPAAAQEVTNEATNFGCPGGTIYSSTGTHSTCASLGDITINGTHYNAGPFGTSVSAPNPQPGETNCNKVGAELVCQLSGTPTTGGGGGGGFVCGANQVCGYDNGQLCGGSGQPACGGNPTYVVGCSCGGSGHTDRQLVTEQIRGNQASSYCSSVVCPAVGSTITWNGKTFTKSCSPGQATSCSGNGVGTMCSFDGSGSDAVQSNNHACITANVTHYQTTSPCSATGSNFDGCAAGGLNCYKCSNGTDYCVSEPGLSCGAGPLASATPSPTTQTPGGSTPPGSHPTPTPTPPAPVCLNLTVSKANPVLGDTVTFTCGQVSGVDHYEFQVTLPDGTTQSLTATNNVSAQFTVTQPGAFSAQCRICTGAAESTCQAYRTQ